MEASISSERHGRAPEPEDGRDVHAEDRATELGQVSPAPAEVDQDPARAAPTELGPAPPTEEGPRPAPRKVDPEPAPEGDALAAPKAPTELGDAPFPSLDPVVAVPPPLEALTADPPPPLAEKPPAPPPEPPAPDLVALLDDVVARLAPRLEAVESRMAEVARLGARDRDLVDRLHADNQTLRAGELDQAQGPLLRDLIRLHDDIERLRSAAADGEDLGIVCGQLVSVLARAGVDRFTPDEGGPFDPAQHQGRGTVPTDDPGKARRIARVARAGFRRGAKVIRPAEVEVFAPAAAAPVGPAGGGHDESKGT